MTPESRAWLIRWKLRGGRLELPIDMLLAVPTVAICVGWEVGAVLHAETGACLYSMYYWEERCRYWQVERCRGFPGGVYRFEDRLSFPSLAEARAQLRAWVDEDGRAS